MKKILIWVCSFILMVFMTACDNNEGPFKVKKENGQLILYSNGKLAKGWVEENVTNHNGVTTKVSEIEYDKGLPTGKFKYYDTEGKAIFNANLKRDGNLFKGTITYYESKAEGTFSINPNWIVENHDLYELVHFFDFFEITAVDAVFEGYYSLAKMFQGTHTNNYVAGHRVKGKCKNGKRDGEWNYYHKNGQIKVKENYKDGKLDGVYEVYKENGELDERIYYKDGEIDRYDYIK